MKRNVVYITCDQLRKDALGIYGNETIRTPNIDALFARAAVFDGMHCASPVCAPNRGAIATGRWPRNNGLIYNGFILPRTETTMMEVFRTNGYATYGAGKMHFEGQWDFEHDADTGQGAVNPQPAPDQFPHYGFEKGVFTEDSRVGPYADYLREHGLDPWADAHSYRPGVNHVALTSPYPEEHYQTTWITNHALEFIADHPAGEKPFFLWLSYVDPHHPFNPPEPWASMYDPADMPLPAFREGEHDKRPDAIRDKAFAGPLGGWYWNCSTLPDRHWQEVKAKYYGMISMIDDQIGRVVQDLKDRGLFDDTIFVFNSDHGEFLGDHHLIFKGYDFGCVSNVPFMVATPEMRERRDIPTLCRSLEVMPTLLDLAGLEVPDGLDGRSLAGQWDAPEEIFPHIHIEQDVSQRNLDGWTSIRSHRHRLTIYPNETCAESGLIGELYDLEKDPGEFENRWRDPEYQDIKEFLIAELMMNVKEVWDKKFKRVYEC